MTIQRRTGQREAIQRALREANRPLSPQEIKDAAEEYSPGVGIATVYRAVKSLSDTNYLVAVEIPGQPTLYELAAKPHHHHFLCRTCGRVFEVEGCVGHFQQLTPKGFELEGHEVILRGRCLDCVTQGQTSKE